MKNLLVNPAILLLTPSFLFAQLGSPVSELPITTKPILGQPFAFISNSPTIGKYKTSIITATQFCEDYRCLRINYCDEVGCHGINADKNEDSDAPKRAQYIINSRSDKSWLKNEKGKTFLSLDLSKKYASGIYIHLPLRESKNITPDEIKLMSDFIKSAVKMNISQKKIEKCYIEAINSMKIKFGGPQGTCNLKTGSITRIDSKKLPFYINVHAGLDMGTGMYQAQLNIFIDDRKEK